MTYNKRITNMIINEEVNEREVEGITNERRGS
jgi:hypothetical protein